MARRVSGQSVAALLCAAALAFAASPPLTPEQQKVAEHISADSMRTDLSYIASDRLEGRDTPSHGLDLAAQYIAEQFRRAGLEPAGRAGPALSGDDGYFQTATVVIREPNPDGFELTFSAGARTFAVPAERVYLLPEAPLHLDGVPVVVLTGRERLTPQMVDGKVVLISRRRPIRGLRDLHPALILVETGRLPAKPQVSDPEVRPRGPLTGLIASRDLSDFLRSVTDPRVTVHAGAAREHTVEVRNVAGLLRGSDPKLKDTYVMLSAHYDHLGMRSTGKDRIFNGANDDGSGTVSVIEIARALAALPVHPARSILFITFFGEEHDLMGSRYYARHPLEPLRNTVADLNLEQMGRTDATNGTQIGTASITGFDFSSLSQALVEAGRLENISVYKDAKASIPYFADSDNLSLADVGVPAHTLFVALDFPDYHGVGDEWQKIDYANMAHVDRAVALGLLHLASPAPPPQWNLADPAALPYAEARRP
jgi:Peptidase family M28